MYVFPNRFKYSLKCLVLSSTVLRLVRHSVQDIPLNSTMTAGSIVRRLQIVLAIVVLLAGFGYACNPNGNDPYLCWERCREDPLGPVCEAACEMWPRMQNCPMTRSEELREDMPYSYPCVCFVNPEDDPVYDDEDEGFVPGPINPPIAPIVPGGPHHPVPLKNHTFASRAKA